MRRRSLLTFVVLNVLISLGVALAVISYLGPQNQASNLPQVITVEILVTATEDPNAARNVVVVTATPMPGTPQLINLPTGLFETPGAVFTPVATIDPELLAGDLALQGTATALPPNCILHTLKDGDTPFGVAVEYDADPFTLMEVNGLSDETATFLQIGDTLIVPLEGCPLTAEDVAAVTGGDEEVDEATDEDAEATEEASGTPRATSTLRPTARPTVEIPPTAANAQVSILDVSDPGDVTAESVEIQNNGATVNVRGWTLTDSEGNEYTFSEQLLFSQARVRLHTRTGSNTPVQLYWGRDSAVWEPGDVVTLRDAAGNVQSTYQVPESIDLP